MWEGISHGSSWIRNTRTVKSSLRCNVEVMKTHPVLPFFEERLNVVVAKSRNLTYWWIEVSKLLHGSPAQVATPVGSLWVLCCNLYDYISWTNVTCCAANHNGSKRAQGQVCSTTYSDSTWTVHIQWKAEERRLLEYERQSMRKALGCEDRQGEQL